MMDPTMIGHGVIIATLAWIARALHVSGVKFDIHIWRNGKKRVGPEEQE